MAQTKKKTATKTAAKATSKTCAKKACCKKSICSKKNCESNPYFIVIMTILATTLVIADAVMLMI